MLLAGVKKPGIVVPGLRHLIPTMACAVSQREMKQDVAHPDALDMGVQRLPSGWRRSGRSLTDHQLNTQHISVIGALEVKPISSTLR